MIFTAAPTIRHLETTDKLPPEVWPNPQDLNPHWVWVAVDEDDHPVAAIITAPAHGTILLLRLWMALTAPKLALRQLIRKGAQECLGIGLTKWIVMLEVNRMEEIKLLKIAARYGVARPLTGYLVAGELAKVR